MQPTVCQFRSAKDATCDEEFGPSSPTKDQACNVIKSLIDE